MLKVLMKYEWFQKLRFNRKVYIKKELKELKYAHIILTNKYDMLLREVNRAKAIVNNNSVLFTPKIMDMGRDTRTDLRYPVRDRPTFTVGDNHYTPTMVTVPLDVMIAHSTEDWYGARVHFKVKYQNEMVGYGISRDIVKDSTPETLKGIFLDGMNEVLTNQIIKAKADLL